MEIVSVFYAAFGYLALLAAILLGMLFVGEGSIPSYMDTAVQNAAPLRGSFVDLGLLLLLAALHRSGSRGMLRWLERGAQSWAAAAVLVVIYAGWQPLPQILWNVPGPLKAVLSGLFYVAWTLILMGAFLGNRLDDAAPPARVDDGGYLRTVGKKVTRMLGEPLYAGILIAMWATSAMSIGHLLLASAVTAYLVFDCAWCARKARGAREPRRTMSFQSQGIAR